MLTVEQAKLKSLLTEAISVLCRNGLSFENEVTVEGLLGITTDNKDVFLISVDELVTGGNGGGDADDAVNRGARRLGQGARKRARESATTSNNVSPQRDTTETTEPPAKRKTTTADAERDGEIEMRAEETESQQQSVPKSTPKPGPACSKPGAASRKASPSVADPPNLGDDLNLKTEPDDDEAAEDENSRESANNEQTTGNMETSSDTSDDDDDDDSQQQHWVVVSGNNVVSVATAKDATFHSENATLGNDDLSSHQDADFLSNNGESRENSSSNSSALLRVREDGAPQGEEDVSSVAAAAVAQVMQKVDSGFRYDDVMTGNDVISLSGDEAEEENPHQMSVHHDQQQLMSLYAQIHARTSQPHVNNTCDLCRIDFASSLALKQHKILVHRVGYEVIQTHGLRPPHIPPTRVAGPPSRPRYSALSTDPPSRPRYPALSTALGGPDMAHALSSPSPTKSGEAKMQGSSSVIGSDLEQGGYSCNQCNKRFRTSQGLKYHNMHHTGNYPYWCEECKKGFVVQSHYREHQARHEGKLFPCEHCTRQFQTLSSLRIHKTNYHAPSHPPTPKPPTM